MIAYLIQSPADLVMPPNAWLSAAEQAEFAALRIPKRRQDWLAGRWTAKRLVQAVRAGAAPLALNAIQLGPACGRAPAAEWPGRTQSWPLSISHCHGCAAAAINVEWPAPVGVDLECIEARPLGFVEDYLTSAERESLSPNLQQQTEQVTAMWCAKEAALKALGVGLTVDARAVNVCLGAARSAGHGWRPLEVEVVSTYLSRPLVTSGERLAGYWRRQGAFVLAIVADVLDAQTPGWLVEIEPARGRERVPLLNL